MENNHQENPQDPGKESEKHSYEDDMFFNYLSEEIDRCERHHHGRDRARANRYWPDWMWYAAFEAPEPVNLTPEQKLEKLKIREAWLQKELDEVRQEITQTQNTTVEK